MKRTDLLEIVENELPQGTVRYSSKIVFIEESGNFKLVHLTDGSIFRTKVKNFESIFNLTKTIVKFLN